MLNRVAKLIWQVVWLWFSQQTKESVDEEVEVPHEYDMRDTSSSHSIGLIVSHSLHSFRIQITCFYWICLSSMRYKISYIHKTKYNSFSVYIKDAKWYLPTCYFFPPEEQRNLALNNSLQFVQGSLVKFNLSLHLKVLCFHCPLLFHSAPLGCL